MAGRKYQEEGDLKSDWRHTEIMNDVGMGDLIAIYFETIIPDDFIIIEMKWARANKGGPLQVKIGGGDWRSIPPAA